MNLFICTGPHPAHQAIADVLNAETIKTSRNGIAKIPILGRVIAAKEAFKKIKNNDYKTILTESTSTDLLAGYYYKKHHPNTKLVAILADPKIFEYKSAPLIDKYLTYNSLAATDLILVGSEMMRQLIPNEFKYKTEIFHPGVVNIKKYLDCPNFHFLDIGFIGRLDNYKATDRLPIIFSEIKKQVRGCSLFVAGDGQNKHLFENKEHDGIIYLGKVPDATFLSENVSIYLAPARFEPSGVAILEAMAQGVVPIVSPGVGYSELVPLELITKSEDDMISLAVELLKDKAAWAEYSIMCRKIATKYSIEKMKKEIKKILLDNNII